MPMPKVFNSCTSKTDIIAYHEILSTFPDAASDYLKQERMEAELRELQQERRRVEKAPVTAAEFKKELKVAFDQYHDQRVKRVASILEPFTRPGRAGQFFIKSGLTANRPDTPNLEILPWDVLEQAVGSMDFTEGMTTKARSDALQDLDARIAELEQAIGESRAPWVRPARGGGRTDARRDFIESWREMQSRMTMPCDVRGRELPEDGSERQAWELLGLRSYTSGNTRWSPKPRSYVEQ